jgi:hypothetical protein
MFSRRSPMLPPGLHWARYVTQLMTPFEGRPCDDIVGFGLPEADDVSRRDRRTTLTAWASVWA